jgi:DNA-binding Xre family transcriptional regulator
MDRQIESLDARILKLKSTLSRLEKKRAQLEIERSERLCVDFWQAKLKRVIVRKDWTYEKVGLEIGVSKQTISKWANMVARMPFYRAREISKLIDYPINLDDDF